VPHDGLPHKAEQIQDSRWKVASEYMRVESKRLDTWEVLAWSSGPWITDAVVLEAEMSPRSRRR
jgi:hypothetical protein